MKRRVRLYIGGMEVEFKTVPDILYNFQVDSLTNPSAVKNSYSKTIQIPGTARNNRIFDNFFLNDYRTTANNFDASRKTEFTIYIDSDVYETGYCRLDSVTQNKHYWEYSVTLFGGLGEFFYNLSYSDNPAGEDEKKKLSDLDFYSGWDSDTPLELGFTINKETVKDAWDNVDTYSSPYSVINFASAYNGLPQDFDADKVLMNTESYSAPLPPGYRRPSARNSNAIVTAVTEDGKTYKTYGGYAVGELSREYTAAEMREFRSYLMRPVLRVKNTIEAICRPENNGGWEVELDNEFFNYENCYYWDLWMTLPMLSTLEYNSSVVATGTTVYLGEKATGTVTTGDPGYYEDRLAYLTTTDSGMAYDVNVKITLDINGCNATQDEVVICANSSASNTYYASAIFVQLVAYDAFGNPVAGSDVHYITSSYGARRTSVNGHSTISAYFYEPDAWNYRIPYGNGYVKSKGSYFVRESGQTFRWNEEISLTAKNVPAGSTLKVLVTKLYKKGGTQNGPKYVFYRLSQGGELTRYTPYTFNDFTVTLNSSTVAFKTNEGIRTGAGFTKKQLLDTDFSPADFILSYMKIFGLYAIKDTPEKKIKILTRKNFFKRDEIIDIQDLVDRSALKITPLVFDSKWYDWNLNSDDSEYGKAYENTYGKQYGQKKINTGYNFNKDTKEVLDDNIFKSAIQVLERSNAFCFTGNDTKWKPWMSPGYSYNLYNDVDAGETYEVEVPASSTIDAYSAFTEGYLYYDLYDKVQLHSADNSAADGTNVLLIHSGSKDLVAGSINLNYYITDDNSYMNILNDGRPCWLYTNSETDRQGNSIATRVTSVPYFSRYKIYEASGYIVRSLDFGKPDEIYIPNAYYRDGSTLYEEFWKSYISDLYSKDSRVVRTKMLIRETPTVDWLRRFYSFDGAIWRMLSINDYNVGQEKLTEVEFVKVQDVENYTNNVINENPTVTLTLSSYSIGASGGTVLYTVTVSDGGSWYLDYWDEGTVSASAGTGDYTGTWTIPGTTGGQQVQHTLIAMADNSSSRATLTQEGYSLSVIGPLEQGNVPAEGGTRTFTIISPDSPWSAKTDYTGIITAITPSTGLATDDSGVTITVSFGANSGQSERQAYIYVELPYGARRRSSDISQNALGDGYLTLIPNYIGNVPASGGTVTFAVSSNTGWTAENYYPNVIHTDVTGGTGSGLITAVVEPNTGASRFGSIYFFRQGATRSEVFTISQEAASGLSISVEPANVAGYTAQGGTLTVNVTSTNPWKSYLYSTALLASPYSGDTGTTPVTLTVAENTSAESRSLEVDFYIDNITTGPKAEFHLTQNGASSGTTGGTANYFDDTNGVRELRGTGIYAGRCKSSVTSRPFLVNVSSGGTIEYTLYKDDELYQTGYLTNSASTDANVALDIYMGTNDTVSSIKYELYVRSDLSMVWYQDAPDPLPALNSNQIQVKYEGSYTIDAGWFGNHFINYTTQQGAYLTATTLSEISAGVYLVTFNDDVEYYNKKLSSDFTEVYLPEIANFSESICSGNTQLTKISVKGAKRFGNNQFKGCTNLEKVYIGGSGFTYINNNAFSGVGYGDYGVIVSYDGTKAEWRQNVTYASTPRIYEQGPFNQCQATIECSDGSLGLQFPTG